MKVFERHTIHEAPERLPELPDDVTIPDDLSGLDLRGVTDRSRPASAVRWMRWLPLILLMAVGAIVVSLQLTGDSGDIYTPGTPWAIDEGPGSNSLDVPQVARPPWSPADGPGSSSLNITAATPSVTVTTASATPWPAVEGPGSNSLHLPAVTHTPWSAAEGPGSNSLNATAATTSVLPWSPAEGPGSNSLGL